MNPPPHPPPPLPPPPPLHIRSHLPPAVCVSMCRHGHKNGRDDVYCVQYDDGDVENLQFRDVRKMLKKAPADKTAYTEAEGKRLAVLEALKKSDAAKHRQQAESAQRSAKIQEDTASAAASEAASPTDHMAGYETAPPAVATATAASFDPAAMAAQAAAAQASHLTQAAPVGAGIAAFAAAGAVGSTAAATAGACVTAAGVTFPQLNLTDLGKPPVPSKPGPKLSGLKSPPKSPTKMPQKAPGKSQLEKKQKKQQVSHRKRKNSTKSNEDRDDEEAIKARKVRVECSQPGFGWLNHTPCQIARVLGRRTRTVYGNPPPPPGGRLSCCVCVGWGSCIQQVKSYGRGWGLSHAHTEPYGGKGGGACVRAHMPHARVLRQRRGCVWHTRAGPCLVGC